MFTYIGPTLVAGDYIFNLHILVNPYKKLPYFTQKEIGTILEADVEKSIMALLRMSIRHMFMLLRIECILMLS